MSDTNCRLLFEKEKIMKATGITRKIDELGRIVIPKEIRRTLRIREGTPLEIFTEKNGEIILRKYSPMGELVSFAQQYADSLAQTTGMMVCISDLETVIAAAGGAKRDYLGKAISEKLEQLMEERAQSQAIPEEKKYVTVIKENIGENHAQTICPIICQGDVIGAVILMAKDGKTRMGEIEKKLAYCAAGFLGRQMEE
jgi:AbrB family transcriptional regulator (stage V sporulation protein T)